MSPFTIVLLTLVLVVMLFILVFAAVLLTPFALPLLAFGAPFIPSAGKTVERMLDAAGVGPTTRLLDLGSGDGRIPVAAAKRGARADGVEVNPWLVWVSRRRAQWFGVREHTMFKCGNLWTYDVAAYDVVTVYGLGPIMGKLEQKLLRELKPGTRVVSHAFHFPNWRPEREDRGVVLYVVPERSAAA
ncbi:MAG: hypothetical protein G01um101431_99 [Parcubacteria group bacterium Gr01-1014_31]|nr:MAG: hypothetical protein G01um101431_99 [Parcubacteria group bacterium Gr01-1014_31]